MCGAVKGVHIFTKGISWKVKVIARLEFEPTHYEVAIIVLVSHTWKYISVCK